METSKKVSYFFGVILLIVFFVFLFIGFGTLSSNSNYNGDTIGFVMNGTYFTGYMVLAIGCLISSVILFATARFQPVKEKPTEKAE